LEDLFKFDSPVAVFVAMAGLSLLPFALLTLSSFIKISVVFALLKNAIGAQQVPSGAICSLLSLVLTLHVMSPVISSSAERVYAAAQANSAQKRSKAKGDFSLYLRLFQAGIEPFRAFMLKHAHARERIFFANTSGLLRGEKIEIGEGEGEREKLLEKETFLSLIPAFVISQLQEAFAIGFSIFLPFLIVDLVIANLLVGLGMMMVSPVSIAMPFKLILFVMCDGWFLLCRGLIMGYA